MGFLEDKLQEAIGSLIACIAMGISLFLVPNGVWLRLYVMLLATFVIVYLIGLWRGGIEDVSWRDAPRVILVLLWAPFALAGKFMMIGGGICLVFGVFTADSELSKTGALLFLGGLSPYAAKWIVSVAFKYTKEQIRRRRVKRLSVAAGSMSAKDSQSSQNPPSHT